MSAEQEDDQLGALPAEEEEDLDMSEGSDSDSSFHDGCDPDLARLVAAQSGAPWARRTRHRYALHDAAEHGSIEEMKPLLEMSSPEEVPAADVDERDKDGLTPLHAALLNGQLEATRYLLEHRADASIRCQESPPLHVALSAGSFNKHRTFALEATKLLIERNVDVNAVDSYARTPLHLAAMFNLADVIPLLLAAPNHSSLNAGDRYGNTPLHHACERKSEAALIKLLEAGADVNAKNQFGATPLHAAAGAGFNAGVELLFQKRAEDPVKDHRGYTAADVAHRRGFHTTHHLLGGPLEVKESVLPPTAVIYNDIFIQHHTCPPIKRQSAEPPPENIRRLQVLCDPEYGILRTDEFQKLEWEYEPSKATVADVLRVHDYKYVKRIQDLAESAGPEEICELDGDTGVSRKSFQAALKAAGAVNDAIDRVLSKRNRNAFCAIRPPGHHAGPMGIVYTKHDRASGSHGFCLLNNVAIGASYALHVHRKQIKRVAIVDFDVHHGNGTEDIILNLKPRWDVQTFSTMTADGVIKTLQYKPWLNEDDQDNVFFASVHGYGPRSPHSFFGQDWFYPGSGKTNVPLEYKKPESKTEAASTDGVKTENGADGEKKEDSKPIKIADHSDDESSSSGEKKDGRLEGPFILNVGLPMRKPARLWRKSWRDVILPRLVEFQPDLILVSAGFDAHRRDSINMGYLGLEELDYYWLTQQLVKIANKYCEGRLISVLEGGYKVEGRVVSPFARSVANMVRALAEQSHEQWDEKEVQWERDVEAAEEEKERQERIERERKAREEWDRQERLKRAAAEALGETTAADDRVKRRRAPVDYVALNKQMDEARAKAAEDGTGAPASASTASTEPNATITASSSAATPSGAAV